MGFSITVALPNCGTSKFCLQKRSFRDKGCCLSLTICLEFCSLCHLLHFPQPLVVRYQRRMSLTTIRSSIGGGRFDPPSGSSRRPRLVKAIRDLRAKLLTKIKEIKNNLPTKLFFLLVGFYSATAFSTFIGQTGDWDVLSAALAVIIVECIGALMYRASVPITNKLRSIITMFNYWKTGLALGLFLDSFKYEVLDSKSHQLYAILLSSYGDSNE
ncbi:unnamed protein product [Cochlearia groenlandica]